jgi:HD-GYP domain-containing protein (c-di-GMP phosphodiesterase class II)
MAGVCDMKLWIYLLTGFIAAIDIGITLFHETFINQTLTYFTILHLVSFILLIAMMMKVVLSYRRPILTISAELPRVRTHYPKNFVSILFDNIPCGIADYALEIMLDITKKVQRERENTDLYIQTVTALAKLIENRDTSTGAHSQRVREVALAIGIELGLPPEVIDEISIAATLHDIGKIGISENILNKRGKLTNAEYELIKSHPQIGYDTLKNISRLKNISEYILYHHEKFDGTGYPTQRIGNDIPLVSRILCVADVYEAITADRVYRKAMTVEQALMIMYKGKGTHFDPVVLEALFIYLARNDQQFEELLHNISFRHSKIKKSVSGS